MTGLMAIFLVIGVIGLLFLLVSLVVGDVFEALGFDFGLDASHDFGVFDSRVIAVFLTAFGGFGAIGATLGNGALGGSLFGLLGGAAFGAIVFYSLKHVGKNLAISLQEFITLSFLYRKRTIKRILFAFIFQTSALPVQSRLVRETALQPAIFEFGQRGKFNRTHGAGRRWNKIRRTRTNFLPRR